MEEQSGGGHRRMTISTYTKGKQWGRKLDQIPAKFRRHTGQNLGLMGSRDE